MAANSVESASIPQLREWLAQADHEGVRGVLRRRIAVLEAGGGQSSPVAPGRQADAGIASPAPTGRTKPHRKLPMPVGLVGMRREVEGDVLRLTLFGPPRTKKTSNRVMKVGGLLRVAPSKAWVEWRDSLWRSGQMPSPVRLPAEPVNCTALFYRANDSGDVHGFYQGLADVLEEGGVLPDDKWIKSWDGSQLLIDRGCPRIEITLTPSLPF